MTNGNRFPGCCAAISGMAEIKPVEPEQGNACAGKDAKLLLVPQLLLQINFLNIKIFKR
jgi:hypothetical protein